MGAMKRYLMKSFVGCVLLGFTSLASAVPALFFDGVMQFDQSSGLFSVDAVLTASSEISPQPVLTGSTFSFQAVLSGVDTSNPFVTVGSFSGVTGDDLTVMGGGSANLLAGDFSSLEMRGANGLDFSAISGEFVATGGVLADIFDQATVFALGLNLNTVFGSDIFSSSFYGDLDGRIEGVSVPEPGVALLIGLGLVLFGLVSKKSHLVAGKR